MRGTILEAVSAPVKTPNIVLFLLLSLQIALLIETVKDGRDGRIFWFKLIHTVLSFLMYYMVALEYDYVLAQVYTRLYYTLGKISIVWVELYVCVTVILLIAGFYDLRKYRRNHTRPGSIKETMDLLPMGLAFSRQDDTVTFSNLTMNRLCRKLTGKRLSNLSELSKYTGERPTRVETPDGSAVWQLTTEDVRVDGEAFRQVTAADITEQAQIVDELEEKNAKLRDIQMRLNIYNKQADRIIIAQELLNARMVVHNEVGNVLLESRHYLKDPASFDEEKLLQALKNTNKYLLREHEEDDTEKDPLQNVFEMADAIGVDVEITGVIPGQNPGRSVLAAAIHECATNTIKHADGSLLSVRIQPMGSGTLFVLETDGKQPDRPIREAGGLLSLRTMVEKEGGTMTTTIDPRYRLMIHLPEG